MGASGQKRTTTAKFAREHELRERRLEKQARKDARGQAAAGRAPRDEVDDGLSLPSDEQGETYEAIPFD